MLKVTKETGRTKGETKYFSSSEMLKFVPGNSPMPKVL
jgi:hypothetical protein